MDKHPNADKLTLCRVNTGSGEMTVVCGAPNARPGIKVPFARVGVTLPNGMKLKSAKIRGVVSEGMLCAEDELKISEDHSGLMILDGKWAPGTPLSEILGPPETVLDLEVTPNRPDCLSVLGIAREVAALYGARVKWPDVQTPESDTPVEKMTRVDVADEEGCPRYTARILSGVKIGPSPAWMKRRLELSGIRAINNVVDITNYVMLECGQPLHAFDQSLLEEGVIIVRRARDGEKMATLDGIDRPLTPSMLVIADAQPTRGRRRRDGRRRQRNPRQHADRSSGKRFLQAAGYPRDGEEARDDDRILIPLRARRGHRAGRVGQPARGGDDDGVRRRDACAGRDRCVPAPSARAQGCLPVRPRPLSAGRRRFERSDPKGISVSAPSGGRVERNHLHGAYPVVPRGSRSRSGFDRGVRANLRAG